MNVYSSSELVSHYQSGDRTLGTKGHPVCSLCEKRLYDQDKLVLHLMDEHHQCFICSQANTASSLLLSPVAAASATAVDLATAADVAIETSGSYFKTSHELQDHFKKCHFLCKQCKRLRVVAVFGTEEELLEHVQRSHPIYGNRHR
jgi:hypothetical protein